jgi:hypothetical protein
VVAPKPPVAPTTSVARGGFVNPWAFISDPRASAYLTAVGIHGYRSGWLEYARTHPLR